MSYPANDGWIKVKFAADLPLCSVCLEESWCPDCKCHWADCECPGPMQEDEYEYSECGEYCRKPITS